MPKILHCADLHAGRPASRDLNEGKGSLRRREIETSLHRIVDLAVLQKPDLLIISGDLFEHRYARPSWAREAAAVLASIPNIRVFIAPGNHDPALPDSLYRSIQWPDNVHLFLSGEIQEVVLPDLGVAVYGHGQLAFTDRERPLKTFRAPRQDFVNIMVIHGEMIRPGLPEESVYSPILWDDVENSGIDYLALGHIHVPGTVTCGRTLAVYPGCPEPLDAGDVGKRGVYVVDLIKGSNEEASIESEFIPMSLREVRSETVDVTGLCTHEQVRNALLAVAPLEERKRHTWTTTLTGRVEPEMNLDIQSLERETSEDFFSLRIVPEYVPDYDIDGLIDSTNHSLEARFARHLVEVAKERAARNDLRGAKVAQQAIYYGLDALRQGRVLLRGRRWN
ncbi:MAG: metallophosphoesterase family protein [Bacillota bacterium]|jgi:exonuclease SbcD